MLRRYQHHKTSPYLQTKPRHASLSLLPARPVCCLSPSLTPIHAEVALGADGLDEAVRPVVKGTAISCGQLARAASVVSTHYAHPGPTEKPKTVRDGIVLRPALCWCSPFIKSRGAGAEIKGGSCTLTHMLAYMRWPFCWFCSRVLARSMGNTQVTPISPAMPPLMSLAGRLCMQGQVSRLTSSTTGWGLGG